MNFFMSSLRRQLIGAFTVVTLIFLVALPIGYTALPSGSSARTLMLVLAIASLCWPASSLS